ncbi:polysaccharide pyruvyl transferase family protein [Enterococcus hirae]|nr:polysaccharide pyruvyl transferase family protein [Enterococcus hirae]
MKILQFGFIDSLNVGDRLIAEEIRNQYLGHHEIIASSYQGELAEEISPIYEKLESNIGKKNRLKRKLSMLIPYHPDQMTKMRVEEWIEQSDFIVFSGGNLLFDLNRYSKSYLKLKWIIKLAKKHNKKVLALSIGIGPFKTEKQKQKAVKLLSELNYISFRDEKSAKYFQEKAPIVQDPVFTSSFFAPLANSIISKKEKKIAISILDYRLAGASKEQYFTYIQQMAEIILTLSEKYQVTIFSTELRDYKAVEEIHRLLAGKVVMKKFNSMKELYELYEESQLIIGTRMHSMIFAVAASIPVIGISWQDKVKEMFQLLDDPTSCFEINELMIQKQSMVERINYKMEHLEDEQFFLIERNLLFNDKVVQERKRVDKLLGVQ